MSSTEPRVQAECPQCKASEILAVLQVLQLPPESNLTPTPPLVGPSVNECVEQKNGRGVVETVRRRSKYASSYSDCTAHIIEDISVLGVSTLKVF